MFRRAKKLLNYNSVYESYCKKECMFLTQCTVGKPTNSVYKHKLSAETEGFAATLIIHIT